MSGQRWPVVVGNRVLTIATQATVVPAKAGIQEIPGERACRLPRVLDSGFRRNDGLVYGEIARPVLPDGGILNGIGVPCPAPVNRRGGFITRPGSGARVCRIRYDVSVAQTVLPLSPGRVTNPPLPADRVFRQDTNAWMRIPVLDRGLPGVLPFYKGTRGYSSIGRARRSQCRGWGFEPPYLHQLAPVAQRIERRRPKSRVGGSSPSRGTIPF